MTPSPMVSVIIPSYNRGEMLIEAIDSVRAQTFSDYELIIVDDGSTDDSMRRLEPCLGEVILRTQRRRGPAAARNEGLRLSRGRLIALLDSDDVWKPDKLRVQVEFMNEHREIMICQTEEIWLRRGLRVNPLKKHMKHSGWIFSRLLPLCIVSPSAVMLRRELLDEVGYFDESLPVAEDYDLWLRIGLSHSIPLIPDPMVIKRGGHAGQQSRRFWGVDRFRVKALLKLLEGGVLTAPQKDLVVAELQRKCAILSHGCAKHGRDALARYYDELRSRYRE